MTLGGTADAAGGHQHGVPSAANGKRPGAESVPISTDEDALAAAAGSFDFLLTTIPVPHDPDPRVGLPEVDGTGAAGIASRDVQLAP